MCVEEIIKEKIPTMLKQFDIMSKLDNKFVSIKKQLKDTTLEIGLNNEETCGLMNYLLRTLEVNNMLLTTTIEDVNDQTFIEESVDMLLNYELGDDFQ